MATDSPTQYNAHTFPAHRMKKNGLVFPSIIVGLALVITGVVVTNGFYRVKALSNIISVTGSAEKQITSDVVKWTLQLTQSADLTGIQSANAAISDDLGKLRAFLSNSGIEDEWVTIQPVTMETMYDYNRGGTPSGYNLRQMVVVEANDIPTVKNTAESVNSLLSKGALVSTLSIEYFYSALADLKQEILAQAMGDAQQRALKMVEAGGSKLGSLRSASMGVLQVTAVNSVEVADYGMYDTSALEKKVTAVVRASFGIQ